MHLAIDGYGGDPALLGDVELARDFLNGFPARIGMTRVAPAQVYTYRGKKAEDWGVSGFALIAESHVTVHTFPARGYANIDIFSCREFDADSSLEIVKAKFGLRRARWRVLERGLEYLDAPQARSGIVRERIGLRAGADRVEA